VTEFAHHSSIKTKDAVSRLVIALGIQVCGTIRKLGDTSVSTLEDTGGGSFNKCGVSGTLQIFKRAQDKRPSHLLAPIHEEVGIVERPRLQVGGFRGSSDVLIVEGLADQELFSLSHFDRRRSNSSKNQPGILHASIVRDLDRSSNAENREVE
jgi:hypothetical protein